MCADDISSTGPLFFPPCPLPIRLRILLPLSHIVVDVVRLLIDCRSICTHIITMAHFKSFKNKNRQVKSNCDQLLFFFLRLRRSCCTFSLFVLRVLLAAVACRCCFSLSARSAHISFNSFSGLSDSLSLSLSLTASHSLC